MKERNILHCDINHCYAQIEEMRYPQLRNVPMVVGGDEERRHGIVLAKNLLAKPYKIQTGEPIRDALKKCPGLVVIPAHFKEYMHYTTAVKNIYREYTEGVESFGLDEAWVDVTHSLKLFARSAYEIANEIRHRVLDEIGLTISIGCSFNKIFAKLGSDFKKPFGLTEITRANFKDVVWPLPVEDLLYVGRSTKEKLNNIDIMTIGDLANKNVLFLKKKLGKMGEVIHYFANGWDESEVRLNGQHDIIKSVGNSVTTPRNIDTLFEARLVLFVLSESVASRLKDQGLQGRTVSLSVRDTELRGFTRQRKFTNPTNISNEILEVAIKLLAENYYFEIPLRSIGVSVSGLSPEGGLFQLDFICRS